MRLYLQLFLGLFLGGGAIAQTVTNATSSSITGSPSSVPVYVMDDKHVLEPGDIISVQILEDQDPATNLVVTDSTELNAPYVGRISVGGKTCRALAADLKGMLENTYYYRATVIVGLDSVNKVRGQAFLSGGSGAIRNGGAVDIIFNKKLTAGEAILLLGGFGDFADKKHVRVFRKHSTGKTPSETFLVDMEQVQAGQSDKDVVLEPGDIIYVPARLVNF
jgi:protein involved in polysaccharide export with SLBB domain